MEKDITLNEAKKLVAKFSNPEHKNKEDELFKIAAAKLLEETDPAFEYEYEAEEGVEEVKKERNTFEKIKEYASDVISNVQSLGAAGSVAFSSAVYFQTAEAIETTKEIGIVIQQVEADYGESLLSYITSAIKGESKEAESEAEEATAEESEESEESEAEETQEATAEESEAEESEAAETQESESNNTLEQPKDNNEDEHQEKTENEESAIETNGSKTKSNVQTDVIQSETNGGGNIDAIDDIKPHSMVGDDNAFEPVFTPHDAIVVSPNGPLI